MVSRSAKQREAELGTKPSLSKLPCHSSSRLGMKRWVQVSIIPSEANKLFSEKQSTPGAFEKNSHVVRLPSLLEACLHLNIPRSKSKSYGEHWDTKKEELFLLTLICHELSYKSCFKDGSHCLHQWFSKRAILPLGGGGGIRATRERRKVSPSHASMLVTRAKNKVIRHTSIQCWYELSAQTKKIFEKLERWKSFEISSLV